MRWLLLLLLLPSVMGLECGGTVGDAVLDSDMFCPGDGLVVEDGVLDCQGRVIAGSRQGTGVVLDNAELHDCNVTRFRTGVLVRRGTIKDSALLSNDVGARVEIEADILGSFIAENRFGVYSVEGAELLLDDNVIVDNGQDVFQEEPVEPPETESEPEPAEPEPAPSLLEQEISLSEEQFVEELAKREFDVEKVPIPVLNERLRRLKLAAEHIIVEREFVETGEGTVVTVRLRPKSAFFERVRAENVEFYEKIPKCFGSLLDIVFQQPPQIIEEDVVYKRSVEELSESVEYTYSGRRQVNERCRDLFTAVGLAEDVEVLTAGSVLREEGVASFVRTFWRELWKMSLTLVFVLFVISFLLKKIRVRT